MFDRNLNSQSMLTDEQKKTTAVLIFFKTVDGFKEIANYHIDKKCLKNWKQFINYVRDDFNYIVEKCKFVFESFPILHEDPNCCKIIQDFETLTEQEIFRFYGQPKPWPSLFLFNKFRFQTEVEKEESYALMAKLLSERKKIS